MPTYKLGSEGKAYYNSSGIGGGGSWVEMANFRNGSFDLSAESADLSTRATGGFKALVPAQLVLKFSWEMVVDSADAAYAAIRAAAFARSTLGLRFLDPSEGPQADVFISKFERNEDLTEGMKVSVEAEVVYSSTPPSWYP
ncbi:Phage major tail protein 2 [Phycisphaerae bacterium RAS1]|nr:Phage major tail protein 2 [Phycisphaerae bacterium RAS1]